MFQFTTTNVINANVDYSTGKAPLWSQQAATDDKCASVNVKRVGNFKADFVTHIYKAVATDPEFAKATLDLSSITGTKKDGDQFRLNLYIGLTEGSNYSLYANDSYYKGRPFIIDFVWKDSDSATATKLVNTIKKLMLDIYNERFIKASASGNVLTLDAVSEYQKFIKADIEKLDPEAYHFMGGYTTVLSAKTKTDPEWDKTNTLTIGKEGFGTYSWILHNLRLPTPSRTAFMAINQEEMPIMGAKYNQYTIHYCVNRGTLGTNAVGDQVTSHTTHVFYVKSDLASAFETALKTIAPDNALEEIPAPAEDKKTEGDTPEVGG